MLLPRFITTGALGSPGVLLFSHNHHTHNGIPFCLSTSLIKAKGFSNSPGCRETYEAVAKITVSSEYCKKKGRFLKQEQHEIPMTALEFGNAFLSAKMGKSMNIKDK